MCLGRFLLRFGKGVILFMRKRGELCCGNVYIDCCLMTYGLKQIDILFLNTVLISYVC